MNRHFRKKASMGVATVALALTLAMTGCTDELEKEIEVVGEAASHVQEAVDQAADKAAADLKAAKSELQTAVDTKADAATLTEQINAVNAAIEAAKKALATADAESKAELEVAIAAASQAATDATATLKTELTDAISKAVAALEKADKADADALSKAITDLTAAIATAKSEAVALSGADNLALKIELEAAIAAASQAATDATATLKTELTEALTKAVAALEEADKADADALSKAITDLTTAIASAKSEAIADAVAGNAALKTELEAAIAAASQAAADATATLKTELTEALTKAVAALEEADKADADALSKAITDLTTAIASAKSEAIADAVAGNAALKTELEAAIVTAKQVAADAITALKTQLDGIMSDWENAADTVIENLLALELAYDEIQDAAYYVDLPDSVQNKIFAVYNEAKVKLLRATSASVADEVWTDANKIFTAIDYVDYTYNARDMALYYPAQQAEMLEFFAASLNAIVALDFDDGDATAIKEAFAENLDAVLTKAEVIYNILTVDGTLTDIEAVVVLDTAWTERLADVAAKLAAEDTLVAAWTELAEVKDLYADYQARYDFLVGKKAEADAINERIAALDAAFDEVLGYNKTNEEEYKSIMNAIAEWDDAVGAANENNTAMITRAGAEALTVEYNALVEAYAQVAAEIKATLDAYAYADGYVYIHNQDNYEAVLACYANYLPWKEDVEARGFTVEGVVEAPVAASFATFEADAYARANAIKTADDEATELEADIADLYAEINPVTIIISQYQIDYSDIVDRVDVWKDTYFSDPYTAEDPNYALFDHAAYDALVEAYAVIAGIMQKAQDVIDALELIYPVDKITVMSGADIQAAKDAFTAFTGSLGDLSYNIPEIGTTSQMAAKFMAADNKFNSLCAAAVTAYEALTVLYKDTVTIYNEVEINALVEWYHVYFALDITNDDVYFPEGKAYKLAEDLTIDEDSFNSVREAYKAYNELDVAKDAEYNALMAEYNVLLALTPSTEDRNYITVLWAQCDDWTEGDSTYKPATYGVEQFAGKADEIQHILDKLTAFDAAVTALEAARANLFDRIDALTKVYTDLDNDTDREDYKVTVETLRSDIAAFIAGNDNYGAEFETREATLLKAGLAIAQAQAISDLDDKYALAPIVSTDVTFDAMDTVYNTAFDVIVNATYDVGFNAMINDALDVAMDAFDKIFDLAIAQDTAIQAMDDTLATRTDITKDIIVNALDDVYDTAVEAIYAMTYDADFVANIGEILAVALADFDNIFDMADTYNEALANVDGIANEADKADLIARADASLTDAIAFIMENHTTDSVVFALANDKLALVAYTIDEYIAYFTYSEAADPAGMAHSAYGLVKEYEAQLGAKTLEQVKTLVHETFLAAITELVA